MDTECENLNAFDKYRRKCLRNIGVFSIFVNLLMLVLPIYGLQVFSRVLSSRSEETLLLLTFIAVMLLLFQGVLEFIRKRMLGFISNAFDTFLTERIVEDSLRSEASAINTGRGYINQMNEARAGYSSPFTLVLFDLPWIPIFVFVIYLVEPILGYYALGSVLLFVGLAAINGFFESAKQQKLLKETSRHRGGLQTMLSAAKDVTLNGWSQTVATSWKQSTDKLNHNQDSLVLSQTSFHSMVKFLRQLLQIGVLALGAVLVITDQSVPGVLLAGSILLGRVLGPIDQGINQWQGWMNNRKSIKSIRAMLEKTPDESIVLPDTSSGIVLSFEAFSLKDSFNRVLLQNIQFEMQSGQCLLIQGSMGAGKSVLLESIINKIGFTSGKLKLNQTSIVDWPAHIRSEFIGYLPSNPTLIDGSVYDNITGTNGTTESKARSVEICKRLGVHNTITDLPKGYDTQIGTLGPKLSDGLIKLIGMARVLFRDTPILLLDEPEAHLGPREIAQVSEVLKEAHGSGKSLLLVSNEQRLVQIAEWVIVLDKGKIAKAGRIKDERANVSSIRGA